MNSSFQVFQNMYGCGGKNTFGVAFASAFQLLSNTVPEGLVQRSCLDDLDDVAVSSESFTDHLRNMRNVFQRLREAGLDRHPRNATYAHSRFPSWATYRWTKGVNLL